MTPFFEPGERLEGFLQVPPIPVPVLVGGNRQVLTYGERREDSTALGNQANSHSADPVRRETRDLNLVEDDAPSASRSQPDERPAQRGLAHTVSTQHRRHASLLNVQSHPLQHVAVAVIRMKIEHSEHRAYSAAGPR